VTSERDGGNVFTDALARDTPPRRRALANWVKRALAVPVRIVVFLLLVTSVVLPPALSVGLIVDGVRNDRIGSIVFGALVLLLIATLARSIVRRRKMP
jgi:hypothetical protein